MGYYTEYNLEIKTDANKYDDALRKAVEKLKELGVIDYALYEDLESCDTCKWYEHESDMKKVSEFVEDVLFELKGIGEESDDMWIKYFKNGKMQTCKAKIVYESFEETQLK